MTVANTKSPFGLWAYGLATRLLSPIAPYLLRRRLLKGKENPDRLNERLGVAGRPRPNAPIIWVHGASVGEALSALPLVDQLLASHPSARILFTTGTVTSSEILEKRLPDGAFHQFLPIDQPAAVRRFIDHWRPNLGLWIEQDLWPNMIDEASKHGVPLALINARMSDKSFRSWHRWPGSAAKLLSRFRVCLAQDEEAADKYRKLGATSALVTGNLKFAAPPLPADDDALEALRNGTAGRPIYLAASTHPREEEVIAAATQLLRRLFPQLLTIIVPRHPERGAEIQVVLAEKSLKVARRSLGDHPTNETAIYLADTLGELGLFYRLANVVFIGGSLVEHGGQNPLEAARLDCCILHGPHTHNFPAMYPQFLAAGASIQVDSASDLARAVEQLLKEPERRQEMKNKARSLASAQDNVLAETLEALRPLLAKLSQKN